MTDKAKIGGFVAWYLLVLAGVAAVLEPAWSSGNWKLYSWLNDLDTLLLLPPVALALWRLGLSGLRERLQNGGWLAVALVFGLCWWLYGAFTLGDYYVDVNIPWGGFWLPKNGWGRFVMRYLYGLTNGVRLTLFGLGLGALLLQADVGAGAWRRLQRRLAAIGK